MMDGRDRTCPGKLPARLLADRSGAAIIEFAILTPVFLTMMIGIWDMGQMLYASTVLRGAVERAARTGTLETGNTATADAQVLAIMQPILPGVTLTTSRVSYKDFTNVGSPEPFNDGNSNGICDNGEVFTDQNNNGQWDKDVGVTGNGGANDVVVYTVNADYVPVFKVPFSPASWSQRRLTAVAVHKNQPYAAQMQYGANALTCD